MNFFDDDPNDLSQFIRAGKVNDLKSRGRLSVKVLGKPVSVFLDKEGEFYALEMSCKHQGANLTTAKIVDDVVTCPRHGWKYHTRSGECLKGNSPSLRKHEVRVKDHAVYVSFQPIMR